MKLSIPLLPLLLAALTAPLRAQCPDGTPPPCGGQPRAPIRAAVPMDPRTWVVLPFENTARAQDLDWLHDASVNLLTMDLSRWSDVRAVDDKRVADFLREVPSARAGQKLSLSDAQGVARRAGAGKLVMGQFLKLGPRTQVTATAYDSRTGATIRTASEETTVTDSLLPLFGKVARKLLGVPPPAGASVGVVGTSRADAYQEYIAGVTALNGFDAVEAKRHLQKALELDTGFALAHYKLAIASLYDETATNARNLADANAGNAISLLSGGKDPALEAHAAAAARLAAGLPPRERALINGLQAQTTADYPRACELFSGLVRADSSDVEALYGLGRCTFKDDGIEFLRGDSTQPRFRSSWNTTLRVLRRALAVDPNFHLAFDHILDVLSSPTRIGCVRLDAKPCLSAAQIYLARVRRDGDSLLMLPFKSDFNEAVLAQLTDARSRTRRLNLEEARRAAADWVAAGPREGRAHKTLARILIRLGRPEEAERELLQAMALLPADDFSEIPFYRMEIAVKTGNGALANRLHDSTTQAQKSETVRAGGSLMMGPLLGRLNQADSGMRGTLRAQAGLPAVVFNVFVGYARIAAGFPGDSTAANEAALIKAMRAEKACGTNCASLLGPNLILGLRIPRAQWPGLDSITDRRLAPARALARGDTAGLRAAARMLDSAVHAEALLGLPEEGSSIAAADAYLILGDSLAALNVVRRMLDTTLIYTSLESPILPVGVVFPGALWPRGMLLRADLEMALRQGDKAEAKKWYRRFLELWAKADEEFRPLLERVRKSVNGQP